MQTVFISPSRTDLQPPPFGSIFFLVLTTRPITPVLTPLIECRRLWVRSFFFLQGERYHHLRRLHLEFTFFRSFDFRFGTFCSHPFILRRFATPGGCISLYPPKCVFLNILFLLLI